MVSLDYRQLYQLQDKVLECIFSVENEFYLTGGTCLSRYYHEKRYSDDLVMFTNSSSRFHFAIKNIRAKLLEQFSLSLALESRDFIRLIIDGLLQVDFINDRVPNFQDIIVLENGFLIDHIQNILSNKLSAILGRDNPKDIFDVYLISKYHSFHWNDILKATQDKSRFNHEDLVARLNSFPMEMLNRIKLIDMHFLDPFSKEFSCIVEEIKNRQYHNA